MSVIPYLRLMRPANIVTSIADILMGFAVAMSVEGVATSSYNFHGLIFLIISTIGLYGGGVVFNDIFDAELDKIERPERPIPSGVVSMRNATLLALGLFIVGILSALLVSYTSGIIALSIALLAVTYDKYSKHHAFFGPLNMGTCRGLNLLLGISASALVLNQLYILGFIPLLYIMSVTTISRGEVHGGNRTMLIVSLVGYLIVISLIIFLDTLQVYTISYTLPFLGIFIWMAVPSLIKAIKTPAPMEIRRAVKAGVISLVCLDATIASGFAGWGYGLLVLLLLPLSILLAKRFAVT
ncbi:MAG TPA: UbiA-like protein EboC [Cytophagaceae bacterium]